MCTIGSTIAPMIDRMQTPKRARAPLTDPDMRLQGSRNAWAIGDCANIINAHDGEPSPPTGQFAERQGRQCAQNIIRAINGEPTRPFSFKVLGQLCSIGGHNAVAEMFGLRLSGFFAWFAWRGVYLFKLPSWSRRFQVGFDWAFLLIFPRDLSHLKTDVTNRVAHAHFEPGDYIIRQGEQPSSFYVIEHGEVEVVRSSPEKPEGEVIAVIGAGNFFGEQALLNNQPRTASVRARTPVEVVVMGRNVFTTVSQSLAPLKLALTKSMTRRSANFWSQRPEAMQTLRGLALADFIEPPPLPFVPLTATLAEVTRTFTENKADFFYVISGENRLEGIITLTDIIRAQSGEHLPTAPVTTFMTKAPATLLATDSSVVAAESFREHAYKTLPVIADAQSRRIIGFVSARRLMAKVIETLSAAEKTP
ncbi:MAG: cyclic nucleotide-binding domain-containing protein [Magnetospirillum sp.]|nr:cyclic nucleotide-binding domain-containing protein [Magnetospirillum sp.]